MEQNKDELTYKW